MYVRHPANLKPGKQLPHETLDLAMWRSKREARARAEASAAALRTTIRREEDGVKGMHVEGDQYCVDDNDIASAMKDEAARADAIKQFAEVFDLDVNHDLGYVPREFPSGQKKQRERLEGSFCRARIGFGHSWTQL